EEPALVHRMQLVELDQVRMDDVREGAELALEIVDAVGVQTVEGLEGDPPGALPVDRLVNDAHAPRPQAAQEQEAFGPRKLPAHRQHCRASYRTMSRPGRGPRRENTGNRGRPELRPAGAPWRPQARLRK